MTAQGNAVPDGTPRPASSTDHAPATHGDAVLVTADIPIAVWRLDARDDGDEGVTEPDARLASRLAHRLVLVYTRRGDAVVDFDNDPHLRAATAKASRSYLSITDPGEVADLDALADPVSLVVLRWPRQHSAATPAGIADLFAACRLIMTADTCAIAAVSSAAPGRPGPTYADHVTELLPAARAAGLRHILSIVAVSASGDGDQFLYYATGDEADATRYGRASTSGGRTYHIDLLVFTTVPPRPVGLLSGGPSHPTTE